MGPRTPRALAREPRGADVQTTITIGLLRRSGCGGSLTKSHKRPVDSNSAVTMILYAIATRASSDAVSVRHRQDGERGRIAQYPIWGHPGPAREPARIGSTIFRHRAGAAVSRWVEELPLHF